MSTTQNKIYSYFDRDPDLKVLFVFNDPFMELELSELEWAPGYRYVRFEGDWFTTKYRLDNEWADDKVILYFSMPSPMDYKPAMEQFPLMDVLSANMEYHHQDYAAYMQQYNLPATMTMFVEENIMQLQSDRMLKLLLPYYSDRSINVDIAVRAFLSSFMGQSRVLEWDDIIIRMLLMGRESEEKKQIEFYHRLKDSRIIKAHLDEKLKSIFGVSFSNTSRRVDKIVQVLKYNAIVQNLSPVDADNYKADRISDTVSLQHMNRILELAMSQPKSAEAFLGALKELGGDIHDDDIIRWYGTDANYYFVPDELCIPILKTLMETNIAEEPQKVIDRIEELMIKHSDNTELATIMDYDLLVARFYERALALGSLTLNTPDEYIEKYQSDYYLIDQLYRFATEAYYKISPTSLLFETIQGVKKSLDVNYAKLANRINLEWTRCLAEAGGMSAVHALRQQDFYEKMIRPVQKKVAVIVSDALRYELAESVVTELARSRHIAKLGCAIAMLPTETKYCKPSLLPHNSLSITSGSGEPNMSVDGKILDSTQKRSEHLGLYRDGAVCVSFEEVAQYNQDKNREIFKHPLVYIFHDDIDTLGHDSGAKQIVNGCSQSARDLATLVKKIHSSYNVTEVYVTADHGFLFNDMGFAEKDKLKVTEASLEKKSRYYLTEDAGAVSDITKFSLAEASAIQADGVHVGVPCGTNRLAAPSGGYMFAHGGASLQEMVIPVIVSRQEREDTKQPVGVMVLDRQLSITASRLKFKLLQTEAVSMDMKERTITVALYFNDKPVTQVKQLTLDRTDQLLDARKIAVDLTLNRNVDAKVLQLKVYDIEDEMNPLIKENVTNNTLIENDFDF